MDDFEKFIIKNEDADTSKLLLSTKEWPESEDPRLKGLSPRDLAANTILARKKLLKKAPEWHDCTSLVYPTALCAEQCSSTLTARHKASLAKRIINEYVSSSASARIADLTGGLGVDTLEFSRVCSQALYNEMDPALAAAAEHNFTALGASDIVIRNFEVNPRNLQEILKGFIPDIIFIDPARRSDSGKKVFLLEDCRPDALELIPEIFSSCRHLLLKLSPMADITMAAERLNSAYGSFLDKTSGKDWNGRWVREIHVIAVGGECKELLVWMDREWNGGFSVTCVEDDTALSFSSEEITRSKAVLQDSVFAPFLFEPGKSLTKAGVFNAVCERFGLVKLGRFTHLYTINSTLSEEELAKKTEALRPFGKLFKVLEILSFNKASVKSVRERFPHSEVTAKNLPLTSDDLRARLGVSSGDDAHIFGVRIELPYSSGNYLIVCKKESIPEKNLDKGIDILRGNA